MLESRHRGEALTRGSPTAAGDGTPAVDHHWRPCLRRSVMLRHDPIRSADLLLMPERVVRLNNSAAAILRLCTGSVSVEELIVQLETQHVDASVAGDVVDFLARAVDEGWIR